MTRVIAHRGASATWPEHTRAAYLQALADGADGLECDVRLTSDGAAVCWHDATVDRTSDGSGPVHGHTLAQMRGLDLLRGARPPGSLGAPAEQLVTLAELVDLAATAGRTLSLAIELKHPAPYGWDAEDAVLRVLDDAGWRDGRVADVTISLMSFHPGSLGYLARSVDPVSLMPLVDLLDPAELDGLDIATAEALLGQSVALADSGGAGGVGPSVGYLRAEPARVRRWVEAGRLVRVWTVDTAADLADCMSAGVAEVTTNDPAGVRRLLPG
ncbi:MAG: hypothetical protein KQH57_14300 [Actinomycetales bacterium]|nr:hypothetical protein [Actinomycetales bacterium]